MRSILEWIFFAAFFRYRDRSIILISLHSTEKCTQLCKNYSVTENKKTHSLTDCMFNLDEELQQEKPNQQIHVLIIPISKHITINYVNWCNSVVCEFWFWPVRPYPVFLNSVNMQTQTLKSDSKFVLVWIISEMHSIVFTCSLYSNYTFSNSHSCLGGINPESSSSHKWKACVIVHVSHTESHLVYDVHTKQSLDSCNL